VGNRHGADAVERQQGARLPLGTRPRPAPGGRQVKVSAALDIGQESDPDAVDRHVRDLELSPPQQPRPDAQIDGMHGHGVP
jgi:hypothetical protein